MAMRVFIRRGLQVILNDIGARQLSVTKACTPQAARPLSLDRETSLEKEREREVDGP
jgi:hypothetical protein